MWPKLFQFKHRIRLYLSLLLGKASPKPHFLEVMAVFKNEAYILEE